MLRVRSEAHTEILLSALWPVRDGNKEDEAQGFSTECPFTIDSFLERRNADMLPAFQHVAPMPGAEKLIAHLAKHNIPISVATGSKRRNCTSCD